MSPASNMAALLSLDSVIYPASAGPSEGQTGTRPAASCGWSAPGGDLSCRLVMVRPIVFLSSHETLVAHREAVAACGVGGVRPRTVWRLAHANQCSPQSPSPAAGRRIMDSGAGRVVVPRRSGDRGAHRCRCGRHAAGDHVRPSFLELARKAILAGDQDPAGRRRCRGGTAGQRPPLRPEWPGTSGRRTVKTWAGPALGTSTRPPMLGNTFEYSTKVSRPMPQ